VIDTGGVSPTLSSGHSSGVFSKLPSSQSLPGASAGGSAMSAPHKAEMDLFDDMLFGTASNAPVPPVSVKAEPTPAPAAAPATTAIPTPTPSTAVPTVNKSTAAPIPTEVSTAAAASTAPASAAASAGAPAPKSRASNIQVCTLVVMSRKTCSRRLVHGCTRSYCLIFTSLTSCAVLAWLSQKFLAQSQKTKSGTAVSSTATSTPGASVSVSAEVSAKTNPDAATKMDATGLKNGSADV
jgi:hypothetical protein